MGIPQHKSHVANEFLASLTGHPVLHSHAEDLGEEEAAGHREAMALIRPTRGAVVQTSEVMPIPRF